MVAERRRLGWAVTVLVLLSATCDASISLAQVGAEQPERLTLDESVARAMARSTSVLLAAAEVRRAEALVMQVRSNALPTLFASATYTRLDHERRFQTFRVAAQDQLNASTPLAVPIIAPLAWADWARAADTQRVVELGYGEVRRQVAIAVANTYLTVLAQRRLLEVSSIARDNAAAHTRYAADQFAAGRISRLDLVRAEQQLHVTLAQLEDSRVALTRAMEALGVLVAGDRPIDAAGAPVFRTPLSLENAEARRADLLRQIASQEAAMHSIQMNPTEYFPRLTGLFQPTYTEPPTFAQPRWAWQLQINLIVPLYDGGLRYGRARERRALLEEATLSLDALKRQTYSEIRVGRESVDRAESRLREATAAAALARQALEISTERYAEGATSNIEVIDAERQARDADVEVARAEDALRQAQLNLLAAAGEFP